MAQSGAPTAQPAHRVRGRDGLRALRHLGYRVYFAGMLLRGTAVWMQLVSLPWYAVELGATPIELGLVVGLQFLPTLVIAPFGGVLADRTDRGRILVATQFGSAAQGIGLFLLASGSAGSMPIVALFALTFGVLTAIELPVRQAYLVEIVPSDAVTSAVSLHATAWNTTRFIGPGVAGIVIAAWGVAPSFALSSAVAIGVAASIVWLERHRFHRAPRHPSTDGVLRALIDGARFAAGDPHIRWSLALVTAGGILGIQAFQTLAPIYVTKSLGLSGGGYGAFVAVWGCGAVVASYIVTLFVHRARRAWMIGGALGMGLMLVLLSLVDAVAIAFGLVAVLGFCQIALAQNAMVIVQVASPDAMRGRVMGLYTTLFQGTSPFGAFLAGWLAAVTDVRTATLVMAVGLGSFAGMAALAAVRGRTRPLD